MEYGTGIAGEKSRLQSLSPAQSRSGLLSDCYFGLK